MKLKIKIKTDEGISVPQIIKKGEWIDLSNKYDHNIKKGAYQLIPLGVYMKLPEGFEAIVAPRSSTLHKFGVMQGNSIGIIDNTYSSDKDEWKFLAYATKDTSIKRNQRVCQFRIQLSQKATVWQKLKWLFTSGVEFVQVDSLEGTERGGFGSTGHE